MAEPTALELASSIVLGADPSRAPLPPTRATTPLAALEDAVRPFLGRPPCVVSFSGGRDSSIVLAVAQRVARREGLPEPVPLTWVYDDPRQPAESKWQERLVRHVGASSWERLAEEDRLDALGPVAAPLLRRHGVRFPGHAFAFTPLLERAAGGSLLSGWGGDELLRSWRWARAASVLARRARPRPRDLLRLVAFVAPPALQGRRQRPFLAKTVSPWLQPEIAHDLLEAIAADRGTEPRRWDERVSWLASRRLFSVAGTTLDLLAREAGAQIVHPLLDRGFLAAMAAHGGRHGWGEWPAALQALFGDLVPQEFLTRRPASFPDPLWGPVTRAFVAAWDGSGVDPELVSADALREAWSQPTYPLRSIHLLQSAWLESEARKESAA